MGKDGQRIDDGKLGPLHLRLAGLSDAVDARVRDFASRELSARIWQRDPGVWKPDADTQDKIANRLGWLDIAERMLAHTEDLTSFADEMAEQGFRQVLLLGMGGSSLCPEVLQHTFNQGSDGLKLRVLDSTDPDSVRGAEKWALLPKTCFIVASKSGSTIETRSFYEYFTGCGARGPQFIAITDEGSELERIGRQNDFARVFVNPSDIGGRYSALSYFGMVPAALIGIDVSEMLQRAVAVAKVCGADVDPTQNPAFLLGAAMGEAARHGRDKLTLISSPAVSSLAAWVEQLVAESTGKEGVGVVPVDGEPETATFGDDRLFVYTRLATEADPAQDEQVEQLAADGHPVITLELADRLDLGGAFWLWELATAVAGAVLEINPFDEPNVKESKDLTAELLATFESSGALPDEGVIVNAPPIRAYADHHLRPPVDATLADLLRVHFERVTDGDFVGVLVYASEVAARADVTRVREALAAVHSVPTVLGFGPRFLHSTGQLYKGGANKGVFLQILHTDVDDLEIPHRAYGFETLKEAQALGDFRALDNKDRRAVRVQISGDLHAGLMTVLDALA